MKGKPGEPAFEQRYKFLLNGGDETYESPRAMKVRGTKGAAGTYAHLVELYVKHMDHEQDIGKIAEGTRQTYERILKRTVPVIGEASLNGFDEVAVRQILDSLTNSGPTYNNLLKAMRRMFKFAKKSARLMVENPTDEIEPIDYDTDGLKEWTDEQVRQFLEFHPKGSAAHLAVCLYLYTACRRSDVVRLGPDNIVWMNDKPFLEFIPQKGSRRDKTPVSVPLDSYLAEVLERTPIGERTFITTHYGKPFTAKGFGNRMRKWIDEAGLPSDISSHGIRKSIGTIFAETDCSQYQLMAAHGHSSTKASEVYTKKVRRRVLAEQGYMKADITNRMRLKTTAES